MAGMKVTLSGEYQGWDLNTDSEMIRIMEKILKTCSVKEPTMVGTCRTGMQCDSE